MEFVTAYLAGIVVLVGMFAVRAPHEDLRTVFALALMWPVSIAAILFMVILSFTGWNLDAAVGKTMFGFRKASNPQVKGFAVTLFYGEVQFYTVRK